MKKRYLILAGLLVMTVAAAGCGKKKTTETAPVEVTATPTPEVTKAVDMVDMQQTADEDIKNIMGEKTSTASKIVHIVIAPFLSFSKFNFKNLSSSAKILINFNISSTCLIGL